MTNRFNPTVSGQKKEKTERNNGIDRDRNIKRIVGIIKDIDTKRNGKLYISVLVPTETGNTYRLFGNGKTDIVIIDDPDDILLRYGGVESGQVVEIFYRGTAETGQGAARIIGQSINDFVNAKKIPKQGFNVASSLPFEPGGIL